MKKAEELARVGVHVLRLTRLLACLLASLHYTTLYTHSLSLPILLTLDCQLFIISTVACCSPEPTLSHRLDEEGICASCTDTRLSQQRKRKGGSLLVCFGATCNRFILKTSLSSILSTSSLDARAQLDELSQSEPS